MAIKEKIMLLRDKLNNSIKNNEDYSIVYKLSTELDELIITYYKDSYNVKVNKVMS